jgi:hypothetical protein
MKFFAVGGSAIAGTARARASTPVVIPNRQFLATYLNTAQASLLEIPSLAFVSTLYVDGAAELGS